MRVSQAPRTEAVRPFLLALKFLTILPVPATHHLSDGDWGRATAWYPAVGLVLGILLAGLNWGLRLLFPPGVAAALLLVGWVAVTGALHLDGFVDCCDALLAPVSRAQRLEILRDVHVGAFGLVGVVLLLLAKYTALSSLPESSRLATLLLVPTVARWTMTAAVLLYPYARSGPGLGQRTKIGAGWPQLVAATLTTLLVTSLAWWTGLGWFALLLLVLSAFSAFLVAHWIQSRTGGLTGDAYGAICELVEVISLLAMVALAFVGALP
jgi:adenosylcobinamide-GDP ribazoletransferase